MSRLMIPVSIVLLVIAGVVATVSLTAEQPSSVSTPSVLSVKTATPSGTVAVIKAPEIGKKVVPPVVAKAPVVTQDPDPVIEYTKNANCGGGIATARKSEVSHLTCCQVVPDGDYFTTTKDDCDRQQKEYLEAYKATLDGIVDGFKKSTDEMAKVYEEQNRQIVDSAKEELGDLSNPNYTLPQIDPNTDYSPHPSTPQTDPFASPVVPYGFHN